MFSIPDGLAPGLLIIPILAFLIIVHELGHFLAARSVGVKVEEFGIGIPPRAKGWRKGGVLWSLNWIPFGGFVRVKGEDARDVEKGSMNAASALQRGWFLIAGPLANFLAAVVISVLVVAFQGTMVMSSATYLGDVAQDSPAQEAGWQSGDAIVAIDGMPMSSASQLVTAIDSHVGSEVEVTIQRGGEEMATTVTPRENPPANQGATGVSLISAEVSNLQVQGVTPDSTADAAGWRAGDQIVAINGVEIEAGLQATSMLNAATDDTTQVTLQRGDERIETEVAIPPAAVELTEVQSGSPASGALLYPGDQLVAIGETPVTDAQSAIDGLLAASGESVELDIVRNGEPLTVTAAVPTIAEGENPLDVLGVNANVQTPYEAIGVDALATRMYESVPLTQVIPEGIGEFWGIMTAMVEGIQMLFTGGVSPDDFVGPVGMGQLTSETLGTGAAPIWVLVATITIIISIGLGVTNLLPIPALDGGRLLFVFLEIIRGGRRIAPEKEGLVHLAGMVLLLGAMFYIAFGDITRLIDGDSFFP